MRNGMAYLDEAHTLYRQGRILETYDLLRQHAEFPNWSQPEALMLCQRVAAQLGGERQARAWTLQARRRFPAHPLVHYYFARALMYRRGPYEAWQWCEAHSLASDASVELVADWHTHRATLAALLRDFDSAEQFLERALSLTPESPWTWCERGYVYQAEDRPQEALVAYQRAISLADSYVPAILGTAHLLEALNRGDEALALLTAATQRMQAGLVTYDLAGLQLERQLYDAAAASLADLDRLFPLADKSYREAIAARRSDALYHLGDEPGAIAAARQAGKGFYANLADNLDRATPAARRVLLAVGYERQDHLTCGPATLTMLARYWNRPVEQVAVVEKICYDGTPAHSERAWATDQGFVAREFTVDWDTAVALIDRGVPFTFTTIDVGNAHLQAVVGYDARRGTLLLRDPSFARLSELIMPQGLDHYRSTGPRGMTVVPAAERARLDGLALPDADLYDDLHALDRALEKHNRPAAAARFELMRGRAADHRLTHFARRTLAAYDVDSVGGQHAQEQLCRLYPDAAVMQYTRWYYLRQSAPRAERLSFLAEQCAKPESPLLFQLDYAEELCDDSRDFPQAKRYLRRLSRYRWSESRVHRGLAGIAWSERRFEDGVRAYRLAACLSEKDERHAWAYFQAARQTKTTADVLVWLEGRCRQFGAKSAEPAQTLFSAYSVLDRMGDAFRVLDEALARRPDDGGLLLYAADAFARSGNATQAKTYLAAAESKSHRAAWLQASAEIASYEGDLSRSLHAWQQLLELVPQSVDATLAIARLTSQLQHDDAAKQFLRSRYERFPHNVALLQRTIEWFRDEPAEGYETLLRRLLDTNPVDGWARRELAIWYSQQQRHADAIAEAEVAIVLDPSFTWSHSVLASVLEKGAQFERAREEYRRALELSIDNDAALYGLMRLSGTHAERRATLELVQQQLRAQTVYGDGLLCYVDCARGVLPGDEVLANLRAAHAARPDLWHAWSALIRELLELDQVAEAERLARESVERFKLLPGAWGDLAQVCARAGDQAGEIDAWEHALAINPLWSKPLQHLAEAYQRQGDLARCRDFVQQALRRTPLDAVMHGYLADIHWSLDTKSAALDELERAVTLDLDYAWAWGRLIEWGGDMGDPQRAENVARALTEKRPRTARAWYWLGRVLLDPNRRAERRAALQRAIELSPQFVDAHVWLIRSWCDDAKFEQAIAAAHSPAWGSQPPVALRLEEVRAIASSGDLPGAIAAAQTLTTEQADDCDAWRLLAQLTADRGSDEDKPVRFQAAQQLVRLSPRDAGAWSELADAHRASDDIESAKQAYRRALELDPATEYNTNCLIDLASEANDRAAVEELFRAASQHHQPSEFLLAREVIWSAKLGERDRTLRAYARLIAFRTVANRWPLQAATDALGESCWSADARELLEEQLKSPTTTPQVYELWVQLMVWFGRWPELAAHLRAHAAATPLWYAGVCEFIERARGSKHVQLIKSLAVDFAALLQSDATAWGTVASVMVENDAKFVVPWMEDWRTRSDCRPWMLTNLAAAFESLDRFPEAIDVRRAIAELPADHASVTSLIDLTADEIIAGRWSDALAHFEQVKAGGHDSSRWNEFYQGLWDTIEAALAVHQWWQDHDRWYDAFRAARQLRTRSANSATRRRRNDYLRRIHNLCCDGVAASHGSWAKTVVGLLACEG